LKGWDSPHVVHNRSPVIILKDTSIAFDKGPSFVKFHYLNKNNYLRHFSEVMTLQEKWHSHCYCQDNKFF